jgi:hypothetical protein
MRFGIILCHHAQKDLLGVPIEEVAKIGIDIKDDLDIVLHSSI